MTLAHPAPRAAGRGAETAYRRRPTLLDRAGERGAAVADFVLVSVLLLTVFLAVFQLGLALHVRNTLIACAAEGARLGARADATVVEGAARTRQLISSELSARFAQDVTTSQDSVNGVQVVSVHVRAPLPVFGPLGPAGALEVTGRAFRENQ